MAKNNFRMEGFKELNDNLKRLEKLSTQKSVLRASLDEAAAPVVTDAQSRVPERTGRLRQAIQMRGVLSAAQRRAEKQVKSKTAVTRYLGVAGGKNGAPHGGLVEFGTKNNPPRPFLRPAWEAGKLGVLERLGTIMWRRIEKSIKAQTRRNNKK